MYYNITYYTTTFCSELLNYQDRSEALMTGSSLLSKLNSLKSTPTAKARLKFLNELVSKPGDFTYPDSPERRKDKNKVALLIILSTNWVTMPRLFTKPY